MLKDRTLPAHCVLSLHNNHLLFNKALVKSVFINYEIRRADKPAPTDLALIICVKKGFNIYNFFFQETLSSLEVKKFNGKKCKDGQGSDAV